MSAVNDVPPASAARGSGRRWLDADRSTSWSVSSWVVATAVFVCATLILGGASEGDATQSIYSAMLIAHGDFSCAYPPAAFSHFGGYPLTFTSPLYTLVSAIAGWALRIGGGLPFPPSSALGVNCAHAMTLVGNWTNSGTILVALLRVGYLSWLVLAAGIVALMRASGKGRNRREAAVLMAIASSGPVVSCLAAYFHPEDLMAMGLVLLAMASVVRERWWLAGVFVVLGVLTQLFVVLAAIPLLIVLPAQQRLRFLNAAVVVVIVLVTPLAIVTSGRVWHAVLLGTSRAGSPHVVGAGGTVAFALGLHGPALFLLSRIAPMVGAAVVAWSAWRRWGERLREPVLLVALVGTCLALRVLFDVNTFNYYYMAPVVSVLLLDALRGRFRGETFALMWLVTLAYSPIPLNYMWRGTVVVPNVRAALPYLVAVPLLVVLVISAYRHHVRWFLISSLVAVSVAFIRFPLSNSQYSPVIPSWCWQLLLVVPLVYWLSEPLRRANGRDQVATEALDGG